MICVKDEELKNYISANIDPAWEQRDFVPAVYRYFQKKQLKVLGISGLRGMGKTTGILQALRQTDGIYLCAQMEETETGRDYIELLKKCEKDSIVIDEYTWIKDREELDYYLYTLVQNGKRVVITGTETIALEYLSSGALINRINIQHVNLFSYGEYCRLNRKKEGKSTCMQYLLKGGVFHEYIRNYQSMTDYIRTAVIENLVSYTKKFGPTIDEKKATAIVYSIMYKAVCPSNLTYVPQNQIYDIPREDYLEKLGVDSGVRFTSFEFNRVSDILQDIGFIIRIPNAAFESSVKYRTYIVNPALTSQLIMAIYDLENLNGFMLGNVYESVCAAHLYYHRDMEHKLYFVEIDADNTNSNNRELDFAITDERERGVLFFECKMRESAGTIKGTESIFKPEVAEVFSDAEVYGRYIIYNGKDCYREINGEDVIFSSIHGCVRDYAFFDDNMERLKKKQEEEQRLAQEHNRQSR